MQEAEFRPSQVLKLAGSAPRTDTVNGWAYLVNWEKNGKADDESSDLEPDTADPSLPQEASSFKMEIQYCSPLNYFDSTLCLPSTLRR